MREVKKRSRGTTSVSSKHQITIPVAALRSAGIRVGDRLRVSAADNGRILLERESNAVDAFAGILTGKWDRATIEGLRYEWD